ncbi:MAG TPA: hypothetical protein PK328_00560 [Chitinophagaceae bacterium]|nr:hypothetical protein [Chitinophagaceae bacterium]
MKAGKPTELPSSPLDSLSPGPAFDKASAWNTLQQRLEKKKTRILFPWKWAAAAALLICCTVILWPSAKKETSMVKTDDGKKNPAPGIQLTGKEEKSIVNQKEMAVPNSPANPNSTADFNSVQVKMESVIPVNEEIAIYDSFSLISPLSQPELTLSAEPAAVKKKLRVVYNNDLAVTDPEEVVAAAEETENPIPLFRKAKLNHTLKAENIQPEGITPRRKKGILFFSPSIKPKD